jgi:hypothetical protein
MTNTKTEVYYVGKVARLSGDDYADISWPIGKEIRVPEEIKEKGTIGRTAGHGVYIILNLDLVDFHTKQTRTITETFTTEDI